MLNVLQKGFQGLFLVLQKRLLVSYQGWIYGEGEGATDMRITPKYYELAKKGKTLLIFLPKVY